MTIAPHDDLERALEHLTAGPSEPPALWKRAVETAGPSRPLPAWRTLLIRPTPQRTLITAVAACLLLVLLVAATLPSLGHARRAASPEFALSDADQWKATGGIGVREGADAMRFGYDGKWRGESEKFGRAVDQAMSSPPPEPPRDVLQPRAESELAVSATNADRQVVRKATIELETPDVPAAFAKAAHSVSEARAEYVQESSLTGEGKAAKATLTLRIAADRLGQAMTDLAALGTVKNQSTTGEDVTGQAVDLDARLRNEQRVEAELLALLEKRSDAPLKDILELRQSLSGVRESIERLAGQRQHLSRLVSLATVLVIIRAPDAAPEKPAPASLWDYFTKNLTGAWATGLAFLADTVAALLRILVGGIIWWTLAVLAIAAALRAHRRTLAKGV